MLEPKNRKLEWILSAIFGVGSVALMLFSFAYFSNQGNEVVLERNDRDVSDNSSVGAGKTEEQQDLEVGLDDVEEKYSDIADLKANLKDQVLFSLGSQEVTATTKVPLGWSIAASASVEPDPPVGDSDPPAGDDNPPVGDDHPPVADDDPLPPPDPPSFEEIKVDTLINYTGATIGQRNGTVVLKAELSETDTPAGDLSGNEIVFILSDGISTQLATATTDSSGTAQVSTPVSLPAGFYDINATFEGDGHYLGSSTEVPFVIWEAIAGLNISGRGWLTEDSEKVNFGFNAKYTKNSDVPRGQLRLVDRSGESDLNIYTEGFNWLVVTSDNLALLQGSASLNGESGYSFELLVSDNGTPGKGKDFFELSIFGVPVASGLIDNGNIVVR